MAVSRVVIVALVLVTLGCRAAPDPIRVFTDSIDLTDTEGPGAGVALGDLDGDGDLDIVQMMGRHDGALARVFLNDVVDLKQLDTNRLQLERRSTTPGNPTVKAELLRKR